MKHEIISILTAVSVGFGGVMMTSCSSDGDSPEVVVPNEREEIQLDSKTRSAAESLSDFYVTFTADAIKFADSDNGNIDKNVVVSPLSASMLLSMLANGVDSDAAREISDYLGEDDLESLNALSMSLMEALPDVDNTAKMALANSIWVNNPLRLNDDFSLLMIDKYKAEVKYDDFRGNNSGVINAINRWCSDKTDGLIKNFKSILGPDSYAVLLNAMYFAAPWADKAFLIENTKTEFFHGSAGDQEVEMMHTSQDGGNYSSDDNFEMVTIPFGNRAYSMTLIVPKERLEMNEAAELLTAQSVSELYEALAPGNISISLPRFKVDSKLGLNKILASRGLSVAGAVGITMFGNPDDDPFDGEVIFTQASHIQIDEAGAKVAAVTEGEVLSTAAGPIPGKTYHVVADRPFFFFIKEYSTGACLMSGRIAHP